MKQKLNLEGKILIIFFLFIILGFAVLDVISVLYVQKLNKEKFDQFVENLKGYYYPKDKLPNFIKLSDHNLEEKYVYVGKKNGYYMLMEENKYKELFLKPIYDFIYILFIWEFSLIVIFTYVFYKVLYVSLKKEQENKRFIEMFILSFTHKLGNFLSTFKVNIEILSRKYGDKAIDRLNKSYKVIESEFEDSLNLLKSLYFKDEKYERIDLLTTLEEIFNQYKEIYQNKNAKLYSDKRFFIIAKKSELQIILSIIIENSFKYGNNIKIKLYNKCLCVLNDIESISSKGTGIGLQLAKYLSDKNRWKLKTKSKNQKFILCLKFF